MYENLSMYELKHLLSGNLKEYNLRKLSSEVTDRKYQAMDSGNDVEASKLAEIIIEAETRLISHVSLFPKGARARANDKLGSLIEEYEQIKSKLKSRREK